MHDLLDRCLRDIRHAEGVESVVSSLEGFLTEKGLDGFLFYDPGRPLAQGAINRNFDQELVTEFDRMRVWKQDPLRLQMRSSPLIWNMAQQGALRLEERRLVFDPLKEAGFRSMTAIPMFGPAGSCDVFAVFAKDHEVRSDEVLDPLVLIAYHVAAFFRRSELPAAQPELTRREFECLQWTAQGKTAWEVGRIIGTSERTANFHLHNAMVKLQARTKHQAVLKALRLGLFA